MGNMGPGTWDLGPTKDNFTFYILPNLGLYLMFVLVSSCSMFGDIMYNIYYACLKKGPKLTKQFSYFWKEAINLENYL